MTNKEKYRKFCTKEKNIPVFSKDWWLDSVCGVDGWDVVLVEKGQEIFASLPYQKIKRAIFDIISMPKLTQTMGVYIKYPVKQKYYKRLSWEKDMMSQLIDALPKVDMFSQNFDRSITNWLPFYWAGFEQTTRYTYVIEDVTIEELEKNLETDIRRRRRKALEVGVEVYESEDLEKFHELNTMTFARQGMRAPYSFEFIKKLYETCKENDAVKMYFAKDSKGVIIAANFLVYDDNTVYYLMGGIHPDFKDLGGMDVVQFKSIMFALENGRVFDFEGSMIESIEKYFRSFGSFQKPYFSISKNNSKLLKVRGFVKEILK
jgi:lipid II:glycine glycyltransferase (peptidoglycan interpeptide bridge formation enzyme)